MKWSLKRGRLKRNHTFFGVSLLHSGLGSALLAFRPCAKAKVDHRDALNEPLVSSLNEGAAVDFAGGQTQIFPHGLARIACFDRGS